MRPQELGKVVGSNSTGFWILRYRERIVANGKAKTVQRAKRLAPVDTEHRSKLSATNLHHLGVDDKTIQAITQALYRVGYAKLLQQNPQ